MAAKRIRGFAVKWGAGPDWRVFVSAEDVFRELMEAEICDGLELEVRRATLVISEIVDVLEAKLGVK